MRFAELDAVTLDGHGTLLALTDPVAPLGRALRRHGVERSPQAIAAAFAEEVAYYVPRSLEGRDETSLAELRRRCAGVFLASLGAELDAGNFVPDFAEAISFEPMPGVAAALASLHARGLALAVVANWDATLGDDLRRAGLEHFFSAVMTSAEAAVAKPGAGIFALALERLGVAADRALHVGDGVADERGAAAAGLHFLPAPLASAFGGWT